MDASLFIARRLRFKGNVAVTSIAISFLVMIVAVAVSGGFRHEIRSALSRMSGDVCLMPPGMNVLEDAAPIEADASYMPYVRKLEAVDEVVPAVYRAGIVKASDNIHGVLFKGTEGGVQAPDSVSLAVSIPRRLSRVTGLKEGDRMTAYFVSDRVKARRFNIVSVHDAMVETDDRLVVYADMADLQRIEGWQENQVSAVEIVLGKEHKDEARINDAAQEIGTLVNAYSDDDEASVIAVSSVSRYPQLFDWLSLIDFNVLFILLLMTVVAGFNMISGLLIMLFENISTIGLLKSLGMTDRSIAKVFLSSAAGLVLKGMLIGNAVAGLFCLIQGTTHLLKLNPENYFVSFVPVHLDLGYVLIADAAAFAVIMILLLIPCLFIAKVDPADTVRVR
ncbi:MAG: ABC transporter permease [Bacteroidales bacterium]|nr:ABC transporter permease [Bacteroidales bacterium]